MTDRIFSEAILRFYTVGWEQRWLSRFESRDRTFLPPGEVYTYYHKQCRPTEMESLLTGAGLEIRRFRTVFWQRPVWLTGVGWRTLDYLLRRTAWRWLDRGLQALRGSECAHNLLWDCSVSR